MDQFTVQGLDHLFCAPGPGLAALETDLSSANAALTVAEDDLGAALMALTYGMLTTRPGLCLLGGADAVARAVPAVLAAHRDEVPLVLLAVMPPAGVARREGPDLAAVAGGLCKWVGEAHTLKDIPEFLYRAFAVASQGRPGPVVLGMPLDVLQLQAEQRNAPRHFPVETHPGASDIMRLQNLLWESQKPLMVLGGSGWTPDAVEAAGRFARYYDLPVVVEHRRQGLFDCESPQYAGDLGPHANPALADLVRGSDTLLVVGGWLGAATTAGFTLLDRPETQQTLIHVHAGAEILGRVHALHLGIHAAPKPFFDAVEEYMLPPQALAWKKRTQAARAAYLKWNTDEAPKEPGGELAQLLTFLRARMPPKTIVCSGSGEHVHWLERYLRPRGFGERLAPAEGLHGAGIAAALAAQRLHPDRLVIAFASRRGFLQHCHDLGAALRHRLPILLIVVDGSATAGSNPALPDCVAVARGLGLSGETVRDAEGFYSAFEKALASRRPTVLHFAPAAPAASPAQAGRKGQKA